MVATTVAAVRGDPTATPARIAGWHLAGLVLGAASVAVVAAGLGAGLPDLGSPPWVLLATLCIGVGAVVATGARVPVLSSRAQVPRAWSSTMSPAQHSFSYGAGLGLGVATQTPSWTLHAMLALLVLAADVRVALLVAPVYAVARGVPVVFALARREPAPRVVDAIERVRPLAFRADGVVLMIVGAGLFVRSV